MQTTGVWGLPPENVNAVNINDMATSNIITGFTQQSVTESGIRVL